eukprot:916450-Pyramimonas_sp.AAC.1
MSQAFAKLLFHAVDEKAFLIRLGRVELLQQGVIDAGLPARLGAVGRLPVRPLLDVLEGPLDAVEAPHRQL